MSALPISEQGPSRTVAKLGRPSWVLGADARTVVWAAGLSALTVVLAGVYLAAALNIWVDEAFTLQTTGAGPLEAWSRTISFEAQPPLYFVAESLWRTANEASIAFARLPSVLSAGAAAGVVVVAAHRIAPRLSPVVAGVLTALNPVFIWAAVEMRVYAFVLFIAAALCWLFVEAFLATPASQRARLLYGVFAIAGLYTQYYFGFVLAAQFFTLLILRRSALRAYIGVVAVVAACFAPFVRFALMHFASSGSFVSHSSFVHAFHEVANAAFAFMLPHDVNWYGPLKIAGFAIAAATLAIVAALGRPVLRDDAARGAVLQWSISLAVFGLLFGASGVPLDPWRHLLILVPSSVLVGCIVLSSLTRRRILVTSVVVAVFTVFASWTFWVNYRPPLAKTGDWRRVAAMLSDADRSTPIAVFPAESALPLGTYLRRPAIAIPRPMPLTIDYIRVTTLEDESDVASVLDPVRAHSNLLWLITSGACERRAMQAYDYHCGLLEAYMGQHYRLQRSVAFAGSLARLYSRTTAGDTAAAATK